MVEDVSIVDSEFDDYVYISANLEETIDAMAHIQIVLNIEDKNTFDRNKLFKLVENRFFKQLTGEPKYAENISVCGSISISDFIEHQERLIMRYSKSEAIKKTKEKVETIQDYLTEICQICLFMRLHDSEDPNNPITRDDDFIAVLNSTVNDCKTALDTLNNLSKLSKRTFGIDDMADVIALIGGLKNYTEDMYYNLGVNEWNRGDRPNGVRIGANLNLILVMIEDMIDFLYGI